MSRAPYQWSAPEASVETAHDVRKLGVCCFCKALGDSLLYVDRTTSALPRLRAKRGRTAHAFCLVKAEGVDALTRLYVDEREKVTLNDLLGLSMHLDDLDLDREGPQ